MTSEAPLPVPPLQVLVCGNVTLDVLCYPVEDVPRHDSINFEQVDVAPGGCASNTAIGLAALGIRTGLLAFTGNDDSAELLFRTWERRRLDTRFVTRLTDQHTAVSVGLIDRTFQPRFVHTPGANAHLNAAAIDPAAIIASGARYFHIGGYFALPGLHRSLRERLAALRRDGVVTSLDVVFSERMRDPVLQEAFWKALPAVDMLLCNQEEALRLTREEQPQAAGRAFRSRGANAIIIKMGERGCYLEDGSRAEVFPAPAVDVVDTTGAGDAFAAGLLAALANGASLPEACRAGNRAGAQVCTRLGAIAAWESKDG